MLGAPRSRKKLGQNEKYLRLFRRGVKPQNTRYGQNNADPFTLRAISPALSTACRELTMPFS